MRSLILIASLMIASTTFGNAECGDRGGPGYRNPNTGKCESWRDLGHNCGYPPTKGCTAENPAPASDDAARKGKEIEGLRKAGR
jgi:hypothetical protein